MSSKRAKALGLGALLLASGAPTAAGKQTSVTPTNGTKKLQAFRRNYTNAMAFARQQVLRNIFRESPEIEQLFRYNNNVYNSKQLAEHLINERRANVTRYQTKFAEAVSAKWAMNGVMPQEIFDAVIEKQVPRLNEWDVFAHGSIGGDLKTGIREFTVPPKTVVVFLNLPGTSTYVSGSSKHVLGLQPLPNRSVTAKAKTGNATARPGAYSVMHIGGDLIPDVQLQFRDEKLPMGIFRSASGQLDASKKQQSSLSEFLKENGPGVYHVISCRNNYGGTRENVHKAISKTERARERQRKYSDPKAFDSYKGKFLVPYIGSNIDVGDWISSLVGMQLSGMDISKLIFVSCLQLFLPYLLRGKTACIVKGGFEVETRMLLGLTLPGTLLKSLSLLTYATDTVWSLASSLAKDFVFKRRAREAKKLKKLRAQVASAKTWFRNRKQKQYEVAMKLRKYGFDTPNGLQLERLHTLHRRRLAQSVNTKAIAEMEAAYSLALQKRKRDAIVASIIRSLFRKNRANARKAKIEPGTSRKATKLMKAWGFKDGMTTNAVNREYNRQRSQYSLLNRVRGRVPQNLRLAYEIAKQRTR